MGLRVGDFNGDRRGDVAVLEIRVALEELTRQHPDLRLAPGQTLAPAPNFMLRALQELTILGR